MFFMEARVYESKEEPAKREVLSRIQDIVTNLITPLRGYKDQMVEYANVVIFIFFALVGLGYMDLVLT